MTKFPAVPDPGNSTATQLATLNALTQAVRQLQTAVSTLMDSMTSNASSTKSQILSLYDQMGGASASILEKYNVIATDTYALAQHILELNATFATAEETFMAAVRQEQLARADAVSALAQNTVALTATMHRNKDAADAGFTSMEAALTVEQAARVDGDGALASQITTLTATVDDNYTTLSASVTDEITARADGDSALASQITTLTATVDDNLTAVTASISSEATARATADSANASAITTLTATVTSNYTTLSASVSTNASAIATVDGKLSASYAVTLDVNGYISGIKLLSSGAGTSSFDIRADTLHMVMPGYSPQPVMTINTINGVPTLTFDGNIIADNTAQNNSLADGAVGHSAMGSGSGNTGVISIDVFGRRSVLILVSTEGITAGAAVGGVVTVKVNGSTIATYVPTETPVGGGFGGTTYITLPTTNMLSYTPAGAGTITLQALFTGGSLVSLAAIELGS